MGSKVIKNSPQILNETMISLTEACRRFPIQISRASCERYLRRGCQGIVLESVLLCGKRLTSVEAVDRFIHAQMNNEKDRLPVPSKGGMSKKAITDARRKYGLPVPLGAE